jgi:hypothetical protein
VVVERGARIIWLDLGGMWCVRMSVCLCVCGMITHTQHQRGQGGGKKARILGVPSAISSPLYRQIVKKLSKQLA